MADDRFVLERVLVRVYMRTNRDFDELARWDPDKLRREMYEALIDEAADKFVRNEQAARLADLPDAMIVETLEKLARENEVKD